MDASVPVIRVASTQRSAAVLASAFHGHPTKQFPLIGVTGTNGKTTVTYLLESILNEYDQKTGLIGTIQMKIGQDAYPVQNTTPDALFCRKRFRICTMKTLMRQLWRCRHMHWIWDVSTAVTLTLRFYEFITRSP